MDLPDDIPLFTGAFSLRKGGFYGIQFYQQTRGHLLLAFQSNHNENRQDPNAFLFRKRKESGSFGSRPHGLQGSRNGKWPASLEEGLTKEIHEIKGSPDGELLI